MPCGQQAQVHEQLSGGCHLQGRRCHCEGDMRANKTHECFFVATCKTTRQNKKVVLKGFSGGLEQQHSEGSVCLAHCQMELDFSTPMVPSQE